MILLKGGPTVSTWPKQAGVLVFSTKSLQILVFSALTLKSKLLVHVDPCHFFL